MSARYICDQIAAKVKPGLLFASIADIKKMEKLHSAVRRTLWICYGSHAWVKIWNCRCKKGFGICC